MEKELTSPDQVEEYGKEVIDAIKTSSKRYQDDLDFKQYMKNLAKASHKLVEAGRECASFLKELKKCEQLAGLSSSSFGSSMVLITNTINAINDQQEQQLNQIETTVEIPASNFVSYEFKELEEVKKKLDKVKNDYEYALNKQESKKESHVRNTNDLSKLCHALENLHGEFSQCLRDLDQRKEMKFLQFVMAFMHSQSNYFKTGWKFFDNLQPTLTKITADLQEKLDENKISKEGQLLKKSNSAIKPWQKCWVVLKGNTLCCYNEKKDFDADSARNMALCTVKAIDDNNVDSQFEEQKCKFEVITIGKKPLVFMCSSANDRAEWMKAIQECISTSINHLDNYPNNKGSKISPAEAMERLSKVAGNLVCADCDSPNPDWASINLGVLVCVECSGVHRSLGTHVSKIRSLTLDKWQPSIVLLMELIGNTKFNDLFEANVPPDFKKPTKRSERSSDHREKWIKAKYIHRQFLVAPPIETTDLNQALYKKVISTPPDPLGALILILQGASPNWRNMNDGGNTPLSKATAIGSSVFIALLEHNANVVPPSPSKPATTTVKNQTQETPPLSPYKEILNNIMNDTVKDRLARRSRGSKSMHISTSAMLSSLTPTEIESLRFVQGFTRASPTTTNPKNSITIGTSKPGITRDSRSCTEAPTSPPPFKVMTSSTPLAQNTAHSMFIPKAQTPNPQIPTHTTEINTQRNRDESNNTKQTSDVITESSSNVKSTEEAREHSAKENDFKTEAASQPTEASGDSTPTPTAADNEKALAQGDKIKKPSTQQGAPKPRIDIVKTAEMVVSRVSDKLNKIKQIFSETTPKETLLIAAKTISSSLREMENFFSEHQISPPLDDVNANLLNEPNKMLLLCNISVVSANKLEAEFNILLSAIRNDPESCGVLYYNKMIAVENSLIKGEAKVPF